MIFTVEDLLEGRSKPVSISLDKAAQDAIALMAEHDFSQLPVVTEQNKPVGIITTDSLVRVANHLGVLLSDLRVRDAYDTHRAMRVDGDLFDLLDEVQRSFAVLIVDAHGQLTGIVTQYDTTAFFRRRAEDMMVVEDIETTLKEYITTLYKTENERTGDLSTAINEVANACRKLRRKYETALTAYLKKAGQPADIVGEAVEDSFKCFGQKDQLKALDDLTIEEITDVLLRHPSSPKIGTRDDTSAVRQLLNDIRDTRNILAHFRGDISAEQRDQLRFCSNWLRRTLSDVLSVQKPQLTTASPQPEREPEDAPTEEESADSESTYSAISRELQRLPTGLGEIAYAFTQIEAMIGRKLPASAREHRAWWANHRHHVQARQWLDAGWKVKTVSEDTVVFSKMREREEEYNFFFSALTASLKKNKQLNPPDPEPKGRSYFCCAILRGSKKRQLSVYASFARNGKLRVEIYMGLANWSLNKRCWQLLFERRSEIERNVGEPLSWERLDEKDASRVALYHNGPVGASTDPSLIPWATEAVAKMVNSFREPVKMALDILQEDSEKAPTGAA